jgi:hypothetical protein
MLLYLATRTDAIGYDEYDSVLFAAKSIESAIKQALAFPDFRDQYFEVEYIGVAAKDIVDEGEIISSFNAG